MLEAVMKWAGLFFCVAGGACLVFVAYSLACVATAKLFERVRWSAYNDASRDMGNTLAAESHWFSESREASTALKIIGQRFLTGRGDVSSCRDEWRKELAEKVSDAEN